MPKSTLIALREKSFYTNWYSHIDLNEKKNEKWVKKVAAHTHQVISRYKALKNKLDIYAGVSNTFFKVVRENRQPPAM